MTYNVFVGTLSLTQSINAHINEVTLRGARLVLPCPGSIPGG